MQPTLFGIAYSPWTERARWALDHHGIRYQWVAHRPYLGEGALRRRARLASGERASVPLFLDGDRVLRDSIDILRHADEVGRGPKLIADAARFGELVAITETGLRAVRGRVTAGILGDREALREQVLGTVPAFMASLLVPLAVRGTRFIGKKYGATMERDGANLATMRQTLAKLDERIDTSVVPTPSTLTAEHILLATFLQGIRPVATPHIKLRPATQKVWTCEPLTAEAARLLAWRDAVYAAARSLPPRV